MDWRERTGAWQVRAQAAQQQPLAVALLARVRDTELLTRAMGLASRAFTAVIPAIIVVQASAPLFGERSLGDTLIERYGVTGRPAEALSVLFPSPADVRGGVTVAGVVLVIVAAFTFGRAFQAFFEQAWRVPPAPLREAWRGLAWVLLAVVLITLRGATARLVGGSAAGSVVQAAVVAALAFGFWLVSGRLMLRGARTWRELVSFALVLTVASVLVSLGSLVFMPEILAGNTARFGVIGAVFSLLSLFVVGAYVLCAGAVLGAVISDHVNGRLPRPADAAAE